MLISPVPESPLKLKTLLFEASYMRRVVVLLKLGNKWTWVKPLLKELGLLESCLFAENVGLVDEKIVQASELSLSSRPYFSLLFIRQSRSDLIN